MYDISKVLDLLSTADYAVYKYNFLSVDSSLLAEDARKLVALNEYFMLTSNSIYSVRDNVLSYDVFDSDTGASLRWLANTSDTLLLSAVVTDTDALVDSFLVYDDAGANTKKYVVSFIIELFPINLIYRILNKIPTYWTNTTLYTINIYINNTKIYSYDIHSADKVYYNNDVVGTELYKLIIADYDSMVLTLHRNYKLYTSGYAVFDGNILIDNDLNNVKVEVIPYLPENLRNIDDKIKSLQIAVNVSSIGSTAVTSLESYQSITVFDDTSDTINIDLSSITPVDDSIDYGFLNIKYPLPSETPIVIVNSSAPTTLETYGIIVGTDSDDDSNVYAYLFTVPVYDSANDEYLFYKITVTDDVFAYTYNNNKIITINDHHDLEKLYNNYDVQFYNNSSTITILAPLLQDNNYYGSTPHFMTNSYYIVDTDTTYPLLLPINYTSRKMTIPTTTGDLISVSFNTRGNIVPPGNDVSEVVAAGIKFNSTITLSIEGYYRLPASLNSSTYTSISVDDITVSIGTDNISWSSVLSRTYIMLNSESNNVQ